MMSRLSTALGLLPSGRIKNRLLTMSGHRVHPLALPLSSTPAK